MKNFLEVLSGLALSAAGLLMLNMPERHDFTADIAAINERHADQLAELRGTIDAMQAQERLSRCLNPTAPCPVCKCDQTDDRRCIDGQCDPKQVSTTAKPGADWLEVPHWQDGYWNQVRGPGIGFWRWDWPGCETSGGKTMFAEGYRFENEAPARPPQFVPPYAFDWQTVSEVVKPVADNSGPPARTQLVQPAAKSQPLVWISTGRRRGYWAVPSGRTQAVTYSSGGCVGGNCRGR